MTIPNDDEHLASVDASELEAAAARWDLCRRVAYAKDVKVFELMGETSPEAAVAAMRAHVEKIIADRVAKQEGRS